MGLWGTTLDDLTSKKTILVTGSSGMVGARLLSDLQDKGFDAYGVSRSKPRETEVANTIYIDSYASHQLDINADVIVNCAGPDASWAEKNSTEFIKFAQDHSRDLLRMRERTGAKQIVNISSVNVYAHPLERKVKEDHPKTSDLPYGVGHMMIENLLNKDKCATNMRLSNSFGYSSGLSLVTWKLFTHDLVAQLIGTGLGTVRSNPNTLKNFIPLSEVSRGVEHVIRSQLLGTYNLISQDTRNLSEWSQRICQIGSELLNQKMTIAFSVKPNPVSQFHLCSQKIQETGFQLEDDIDNELRRLFRHAERALR